MPRLDNGLEALVLTRKDTTTLEDYYLQNLRSLQLLPRSTATPAVYLLLGVPPFEAQVHVKTLTFFMNSLRRCNSLEYELIQRQLIMKDSSSKSWPWYIQDLLAKYHLPNAFRLLHNQPSKTAWKRMVKDAVLTLRKKHEARKHLLCST